MVLAFLLVPSILGSVSCIGRSYRKHTQSIIDGTTPLDVGNFYERLVVEEKRWRDDLAGGEIYWTDCHGVVTTCTYGGKQSVHEVVRGGSVRMLVHRQHIPLCIDDDYSQSKYRLTFETSFDHLTDEIAYRKISAGTLQGHDMVAHVDYGSGFSAPGIHELGTTVEREDESLFAFDEVEFKQYLAFQFKGQTVVTIAMGSFIDFYP